MAAGRPARHHRRRRLAAIYAAQWLLEQITIRVAGERFTRRQLPRPAAGSQVVETERRKAGSVERIHAVKPASPTTTTGPDTAFEDRQGA
jgi:hypothetical protein